MATINFYVNKPDKLGKCFILLTYLANGEKFRHAIETKILKSQWLPNKQRIKANGIHDEYLNAHLSSLESIISTAERESLLVHNTILFSFVKQKFNDTINKTQVRKNFLESYMDYIESSKGKKDVWTIKRYITSLNHLKNFRKAKKYELSFERINSQFYEAYMSYMINDCKLLNNTVGNYMKTLKSFMNYATEMGYNRSGTDFKKFKTHLPQRLSVVRDNFCFACFTGLRYSDIQILQAANVKEDYVELRTEKTKDYLKIPLTPYAKDILERNGGMLTLQFTNQKTNVYLKEIGEIAGLDERILIVKYRGVEKVEFVAPKYKFLCTHTARRTFVTLSLEKGMRPETVMAITGHRDYKTFKKYIKLTDKVKLVEMNKVWAKKLYIA
jgi:site-specific recombinase XerD